MKNMKKMSLKKLLGTALFLILTLEVSSHPALASQAQDNKGGDLTPAERVYAAQLRAGGASHEAALAAVKARREEAQKKTPAAAPSQAHLDEIASLKKEKAEAEKKIELQAQELKRLNEIEDKRLKTLTGQDGGKSIPQADVLSIAEIARLQDENRKLAKALEGFEEGSRPYKTIKEELERTQSELEKVKREVEARSASKPNAPQTPPPMPQKAVSPTPPAPTSGDAMKRGGPPAPGAAAQTRGGPPPPPGSKTVVKKTAEEIQSETNTLLINQLNTQKKEIVDSINQIKALTSDDKREHMKLLVEELLGLLKTYAEQHITVPGQIAGTPKKQQEAVTAAVNNLMNRLDITTTMLQFSKNTDTKALNTEESDKFIARLTGFLEKAEQYIHEAKGNPLELKGSNFSIGDILVPKKATTNTLIKAVVEQTSENKSKSTLRDTLKILYDVDKIPLDKASKPEVDSEVAKALEEVAKSPNIFQDLSAADPEALRLLVDTSLSLNEIQQLWKKIPQGLKEAKLKVFSDNLFDAHPIKGMTAETDFLKLLQEKEISPQAIGLAPNGTTTGVFRNTVLRNFIKLKLIAEIVIGYRATLGSEEEIKIKALQSKNYAQKMHKESVEKGSSPIKDESLRKLNETIKGIEDEISALNKKREEFAPTIEIFDKIIMQLYALFAHTYTVPALFKDFLRTPEAQAIMSHPHAQKTTQILDQRTQEKEKKNLAELEERKRQGQEALALQKAEEERERQERIKRQQEAMEKKNKKDSTN